MDEVRAGGGVEKDRKGRSLALFALRSLLAPSPHPGALRPIQVCHHGAAIDLQAAPLLCHQVQPDPRGQDPWLVLSSIRVFTSRLLLRRVVYEGGIGARLLWPWKMLLILFPGWCFSIQWYLLFLGKGCLRDLGDY